MKPEPLIDLAGLIGESPLMRKILAPLLIRPLEKLLAVDQLNEVYEGIKVRAKFAPDENFFDLALAELGTNIRILSGNLESIPNTGPVFVVSNHPFGAVDGLILGSLLMARREDSKLLANELLGRMPEIGEHLLPVNPFGTKDAVRKNLAGLRAAGHWLADGHCVGTFPAGYVSSYRPELGGVRDREWHSNVAGLARKFGATVVPLHFEGHNSALFQALGRLHPKLRMAALVREVFNPDRSHVDVRIGSPIEPHQYANLKNDRTRAAYFQMRSEVLRYQQPSQNALPPTKGVPIIERQPVGRLIDEVESLPEDCLLCKQGVYQVYSATGSQIPVLLEEIGRTRELTFRSVGEGVGKAVDIDRFDHIYHHLFLWNNETCEIIGAYRIGLVNDIIAKHGFDGLYTNKVIEYSEDAFRALGPGGVLELGRSYIVPDYQKRGTSLFLLWRGIVKFIRKHPGYSKLFGTVSISDRYSPMSQALLIAFMKRHSRMNGFEELIRAKKKSQFEDLPGIESFGNLEALPSAEKVGSLIAELEPDGKGFPVLLKHYLQLNGEILGVGVDTNFGDVLDGFILVDLEKIDPVVLQKYEGRPKSPKP